MTFYIRFIWVNSVYDEFLLIFVTVFTFTICSSRAMLTIKIMTKKRRKKNDEIERSEPRVDAIR